jgi:5-methylthioadenosine/S-adenosylhomocysteine deaminase
LQLTLTVAIINSPTIQEMISPRMNEIALINGLILQDPRRPQAKPHSVTVVSDGKLSIVNGGADPTVPSGDVIDCSGCLIMPGLVNAHTHAAMAILRGLADDVPLDTWLNDYIFPTEARFAAPEFVYLGAKLAAVEMILSGITCCADGYFFMEQSARAFAEVGLRAVVAQGILDVPTPDAPEPGSWKGRVEVFLRDFPSDPLVTPALFCHSPYLCGPETLRSAWEICKARDIKLFVHVAETAHEVEEIKARYDLTPVEHLSRMGIMGERLVAVHCVHLSEREKEVLAELGTRVVHCPESIMKLASGAAPVADLLAKGALVALGTDGPASNNNLDMFEEMRSASFMAKLVGRDPLALDAATMIRMASINGAQALDMETQIGILEPGKAADLIVVNLQRPHLTPLYDPISHLVYCARGSDVRDAIVNGRPVVRDGRVTTINEADLREEVLELASRIARDLGRDIPGGSNLKHD